MSIIRLRNPLIRPNEAPGFNPFHPASADPVNFAASVVCIGGSNFASFWPGKQNVTYVGTVTGSVSAIGPVATFGTTACVQVGPGSAAKTLQNMTYAAIIITPASYPARNSALCVSNDPTLEPGMFIDSTGRLIAYQGTVLGVGPTLSVSTEYFVAASYIGGNFWAVALKMLSGAFTTVSGGPVAVPAIGTATAIQFGNYSTTNSFTGLMAAGMLSTAGLSLGQLRMWATDPWSFWYPKKRLVGVGAPILAPPGPVYKPMKVYVRR